MIYRELPKLAGQNVESEEFMKFGSDTGGATLAYLYTMIDLQLSSFVKSYGDHLPMYDVAGAIYYFRYDVFRVMSNGQKYLLRSYTFKYSPNYFTKLKEVFDGLLEFNRSLLGHAETQKQK